MNLDSKFSTEHLQELLIKTPGISLQNNSDFVYKFTNSSITEALYIYLEKGVVIASFSKDLLAKSITKNKVALDKNLIEEINKTSNKSQSSPINLFLNHKATTPFLAQIIKKEKLGALAMLDGINGSSTLSMNFKSDALIFNGISTTDTSTLNYFNIFLHQKSAANALKNVVPKNTANFLAFGLSDIKIFQKDLTTYLKKAAVLDKLEAQIKDVEINSGIDLKRDLKPQWDKEFILINNSYGEKFAIIKVKDGRKTNFTLQLISRPINESISQLNYSNLFYYFFGEPLKSFSKPYFAIADNYLIISNTPGVIKNYLFEYENEQFLSSTNEFKKYDQLLANQSNVFYFLHTKNSQRQFKSILKPQNAALFSDKNYGLKDFYALSYQWSGDKDHFYTNLYLSQPELDTTSIKTVKE
jgi:hypothetical protein